MSMLRDSLPVQAPFPTANTASLAARKVLTNWQLVLLHFNFRWLLVVLIMAYSHRLLFKVLYDIQIEFDGLFAAV